MGKSIHSDDPFVLDEQDKGKAPRTGRSGPQKSRDPFVLDEGDSDLVKKKVSGSASGDGVSPTTSGLLSEDAINKASKAYQDKTLSVEDQDVLAQTDWGKQQGLVMPKEWKKSFVQAHNSPQASELSNSVLQVLNANYPRAAPGTPESQVREQILSSVQKGDIPAILKARNSIVDSKQAQILKIKNNPQGGYTSSGVIGQPLYALDPGKRTLSDEQKRQVAILENEMNTARSALDAYTIRSIVGKKENQLQLKAELSPQNTKFSDLTVAAQNIGQQIENTVGITKTIPNNRYEQTRAGLEAILTSYQLDINDMIVKGMKAKNPELLKQAQEKMGEMNVLQARYNNLDNQFPDVGVYKTARYLGDILQEMKPNRLITTSKDVQEAAAEADKRTPGFLQSHRKFVDVVAQSEGNWIGVKSGMLPQGGVLGGIKAGTEKIGYGGAQFVASPFGKTWDPKTFETATAWLEEPQVKGTSTAGQQPTRIVYDKESKAYREIKNEDYGQWNFNSAMYSLGQGLPTLAEWVVLDKGIGGAAKGLGTVATRGFNLVGKEIAATTNALIGAKDLTAGYEAAKLPAGFSKTAGLYATTYITSFDENHKLAENLIKDNSSIGEAKKNALANFLTLSTAGVFSMLDYSPTKAVEAALSKNAAPEVLKFLEKSNWEKLSQEETSKLLKDQIWPRVKAIVKAAGQSAGAGAKLGAAGVIDQKIKDFTSLIVNPDKAAPSSVEDNLHSFVDQVLLMTVVGLPSMVSSGRFPQTSKDALYQAGLLAPQYIDRINERAASGDLTQQQANNMIGIVKTMAEEVDNARQAVNKDGLPLTTQQRRDLAVSAFRKRAADMLEENKVPVGAEAIKKDADANIQTIRDENKWHNLEESVPFQTARDLETGKKIQRVDDIDPDKQYTYDKEGKTVTSSGAELFDHLINGDYEQVKSKDATAPEGKGAQTAGAEKDDAGAKSEAGQVQKNVSEDLLRQGKDAIEKGIAEGKLKGVYVNLARAQPEAFLKEISDQARGVLATGEEAAGEGLQGEDAELAARDQYGDDIVDAAKRMFPKEKPASPPTTVIRHAESQANAAKKPSTDETPLTATGEKQAEKLGEKLKQEGYSDVLPSATTRAMQTAEKAVERTGGQIIEDPALSQLLKEWDQSGGETIDQFADRIAKAREAITKLTPGTAVIAHGKVMAMLEALDKADGDVEKAKQLFDKSKVYGNTDTYIPSQKKPTNEEEVKLNQERATRESKTSTEDRPEGRKEGDGKSPAGSEKRTIDRDVSQTTKGKNGPGKEGDVLKKEGAAPESAAPSRQTQINDLLDKVASFNKLRKNDPAKASQLNEIRLAAKEIGVKVDYAKGFVLIKDDAGNKIQRQSEETNITPAKNFDINVYSDKTKQLVTDMLVSDLPLTGLSVLGFDSRLMSEAQKERAINDIRTGDITNGAKAVYDALEQMVQEGFVELIDPSTRQRVGIPLDEYIDAVREGIKPLDDNQLAEFNTLLGEDVFGKVFDDIFAEETISGEQPTKETETTEQPASGGPAEGPEETGGGEDGAGPDQPTGGETTAEAAVPEEKVTGIRNIIVNTERMDRSLDPVVKEAATNFKETWETARDMVKTGTVDPRSLVNSLFGEAKPKVSDIDNALILMDRIDLTNQRLNILKEIESAEQGGDEVAMVYLGQRLLDVEQKIAQNDEVSDRTGQETARALSSRRMLATLDFTLSKMTAEIRSLYPQEQVPGSVTERLKKIEKDHAELLRKFAEREEQWKQEQAQRAFQEEKNRVSGTSKTPKGEKKIALKGKDLADKIRSLRPKGGDTAQSNIFGLPIAVYDTVIITIANLVEKGAKLADAIVETIKDVNFENPDDRQKIIDHINGFVAEDVRANLVNTIVRAAKDQGQDSIVKDAITPLRKLASYHIKEGASDLDDMIGRVHADLVGQLPEVTKRDVRDAFSGYGNVRLETRNDLARQIKDLQRQAVLISQMEDVAQGEMPEKTSRKQGKPSKKVNELKAELEKAMKDAGMTWELPPRNKEEQAQRALQAAKTRLKNQIEVLTKRIDKGEAPPQRTPTEWDDERRQLVQERDHLKKILAETTGPSKLTDEMRIKRLENSLKKQIAGYEEAIRAGGRPLRDKTEAPTSPDIALLKARRDQLKEMNRALMLENNPKATPQQIALQAYKDRVKSRIDTLTTRAAEGDFETKEREPIQKDAEAMKLDLALKKTESEFYTLKAKAAKANKTKLQKLYDRISAYKRFAVLSGLPSLGKIGLAVTYRTIGTPVEELVGAGLRQLPGVRSIAALAPREGRGFSFKTEGAALGEWAKAKTYQDWLEVLKKGKGELDIRMGKYAEDNPELIELFGRIHASMKNFSKRAEFARSYEARIDYARRKGFDTSDEVVQMTAALDAYTDASRSIFMQENILTKEYFKLLKRIEGDKSGWIPRTAAFLARFTMPVVKVPTNFIAETGTFALGAFSGTAQILYHAFSGNLEKLTPHEADLIMRSLKKGSIGLTLGVIGFLMPQLAGGYWQRGVQRDEDEIQPGELEIFGQRIPRWATHFPALEVLQMGSTLRRAYDRSIEEKGEEPQQAIPKSIFTAAGGLLGEVPLFEQPTQLMERFKMGEWDKLLGDQFKSLDPQLIQNIANWTDREEGKTVKRAPENPWESLETGIPGLRQRVERKQ
jgi:hypothetical protein